MADIVSSACISSVPGIHHSRHSKHDAPFLSVIKVVKVLVLVVRAKSESIISTMTTSLQRAAAQSSRCLEAKDGAFESSFAAGLDLSEFGLASSSVSDSNSEQTTISAAAELLRVKTLESKQAAQEQKEEEWIQQVAIARGKELQAECEFRALSEPKPQFAPSPHVSQLKNATDLMVSANVGDALVHMHGQDAANRKSSKAWREAKKTVRRTKGCTFEIGDKKKAAVNKMAKRAKY